MISTYMYTQVVCFAQRVETSTENRCDHVFSWVLSATPDCLLKRTDSIWAWCSARCGSTNPKPASPAWCFWINLANRLLRRLRFIIPLHRNCPIRRTDLPVNAYSGHGGPLGSAPAPLAAGCHSRPPSPRTS